MQADNAGVRTSLESLQAAFSSTTSSVYQDRTAPALGPVKEGTDGLRRFFLAPSSKDGAIFEKNGLNVSTNKPQHLTVCIYRRVGFT